MEIKTYEVGGCLRDEFLGIKSKDVDFAVEVDSFLDMKDWMIREGFEIFLESRQFLTIRARVPEGHILLERTKVADFVMCRKDSEGSDGRRPDYVEPGDIYDDLARRDFTMNAIARTDYGFVIDPYNGVKDIESQTLRFVGNPMDRIREDGLRVARGFRFLITKDLSATDDTMDALTSFEASEMLRKCSVERLYEELRKMLEFDNYQTVAFLESLPQHTYAALTNGLELKVVVNIKQ